MRRINPFYLIVSIAIIGFLPFLFIFIDRIIMRTDINTEFFFFLETSIFFIGALSVVLFVIFLTLK